MIHTFNLVFQIDRVLFLDPGVQILHETIINCDDSGIYKVQESFILD